VDLTANEINIMKKKLDLISVVLYCSRVPCISQDTFKRGRKLFLATCCGVYHRRIPSETGVYLLYF
jgi:hypothetical protein